MFQENQFDPSQISFYPEIERQENFAQSSLPNRNAKMAFTYESSSHTVTIEIGKIKIAVKSTLPVFLLIFKQTNNSCFSHQIRSNN